MAQIWAFVMAHQAVMAGAVVGVLDLVFALSPGLASNGILHSVYLFVKKLVGGAPAA